MKIYTNLNPNYIVFQQLYTTLIENFKITLHFGLAEIEQKEQEKIIFWFAKSNASKLHYYRICEAIESIYQGLVKIENHKELIK
jgi:hypothetical protein